MAKHTFAASSLAWPAPAALLSHGLVTHPRYVTRFRADPSEFLTRWLKKKSSLAGRSKQCRSWFLDQRAHHAILHPHFDDGRQQNRRQKVFNRGVLRSRREAWHSKNWLNLHWFEVFHISIRRGFEALFRGTKPTKCPPWRRDWKTGGEASCVNTNHRACTACGKQRDLYTSSPSRILWFNYHYWLAVMPQMRCVWQTSDRIHLRRLPPFD